MIDVIVLGILIGLGYWAFAAGKRDGSRKGYAAGRFHRR